MTVGGAEGCLLCVRDGCERWIAGCLWTSIMAGAGKEEGTAEVARERLSRIRNVGKQ